MVNNKKRKKVNIHTDYNYAMNRVGSKGSTKAGGGSRSLKPLGARNQELIQ